MNSSASIGAVPRVLVADDSETIQKVVKIALARHPVKIETSSTWQDAAQKIGSGIALLMLDVNLPGVGSDPQKVKEVVAAAAGLPVVVMQGTHDRSLGEATLRECGVNHIIQKPFDSAELVATVTRLTGAVAMAKTPASGPSAPPPPPASFPGGPASDELSLNLDGLPPLPPIPGDLVDSSRKGKKAFDVSPSSGATAAPAMPDVLDPFATGPAPIAPEDLFKMVPPPPPASPGAGPSAPSPNAPVPDPVMAAKPSSAKPSPAAPSPVSPASSAPVPGNEEMARQIRQAVEAYCEKHFRSLAIEVISAELRRLAEEKARHLVDI